MLKTRRIRLSTGSITLNTKSDRQESVSYEMHYPLLRGGSRTAATSKMEHFVIIVNGFQPLTIIRKSSILDDAAVLDPPLLPALRRSTSYSEDAGSFV